MKTQTLLPQKSSVPYQPKHKIRVVTAASLFDGHDAAINIMRRILQTTGAEVIHLGHNRSVEEIVISAIQEDAQAVAITSYQGGHMEFFRYLYDRLREEGVPTKVFGGGGGTILPSEIEELHRYGISRIYSPEDGRKMGLQGMINDLLEKSDFATVEQLPPKAAERIRAQHHPTIAQTLTLLENHPDLVDPLWNQLEIGSAPVVGITGVGGSGKSSLTDEVVRRFLMDFPDKTLAILSVDPTKRKSGGALLGDRIRMNSIYNKRVYMRSFATRSAHLAISQSLHHAIGLMKAAGFDLIIVETAGIGQGDTQIVDLVDLSIYVMTPEYGAATQLEKIDMIDFADLVCINKFDKQGAEDALRDVQKQYQRSHQLWKQPLDEMPVYPTVASQFGDLGTNRFYKALIAKICEKTGVSWQSQLDLPEGKPRKIYVIPPTRVRYLDEIVENHERYEEFVEKQSQLARKLYQIHGTIEELKKQGKPTEELEKLYQSYRKELHPEVAEILEKWEE